MIPPYSGPLSFSVGPLHYQLFGALVVTGVLVGHRVVLRLAAARGIDVAEMRAAAAWALVAGFIGAHVVDTVFYHPEKIAADGVVALLKIWDGISSYGGFLGALVGVGFYFFRLKKSWWPHADILMQGLVFGWIFGRLGCTLASDHPGTLTSFPLAFAYPTGARHNLGFYELLFTVLVLVPAILALHARERSAGYRPGIYTAAIAALYAPARFLMDFLRATDLPHSDPRVYGLTAAQYISVVVFVLALALLRKSARPLATTA
ncbi:MAG TPA: prolipoprotein diacylglyceryl transferase family protein [Candidatus Binatia bacterium]|jgi:phosphatidylglycerol:prolipoprotein diacylglycerol transferase